MKLWLQEFVYWRIKRPANKLYISFIWKLPKSMVYWCVIRAASVAEPNKNPSSVTAEEMLEAIRPS